MILELGPFILGGVLLLWQAAFDRVWKRTHRDAIASHVTDEKVRDTVASAAEWAADVAAFVPAATLTLVGVIVLLYTRISSHHDVLVLVAVLTMVVIFGIYIQYATSTNPLAMPRLFRSLLWWSLLVLNIVGFVLTLALPRHHDEDAATVSAPAAHSWRTPSSPTQR